MKIVVEVTDLQFRMLETMFSDPKLHIKELVDHFLYRAELQIVEEEMKRLLNDPNTSVMPATREELLANAPMTPIREIVNEQNKEFGLNGI